MIIFVDADDPGNPQPKSEDLWDGQVCMTDEGMFLWDAIEDDPVPVRKRRFLGRDGVVRYLNTEDGFDKTAETLAGILRDRSEEWDLSEITEHGTCEVVSNAIGVGTEFFGRRVFKHLGRMGPDLPDGHFLTKAFR